MANRYVAKITIDGQPRHTATFPDAEGAHAWAAMRVLRLAGNPGEVAATIYPAEPESGRPPDDCREDAQQHHDTDPNVLEAIEGALSYLAAREATAGRPRTMAILWALSDTLLDDLVHVAGGPGLGRYLPQDIDRPAYDRAAKAFRDLLDWAEGER